MPKLKKMSGRLNSVIRRERVAERETERELSTDVHYDALTSLKYRKKNITQCNIHETFSQHKNSR